MARRDPLVELPPSHTERFTAFLEASTGGDLCTYWSINCMRLVVLQNRMSNG
jgi:hypothetical protein